MTESLLVPIQEKEEPVKKRTKKAVNQEDSRKEEEENECEKEADKSVQLEQTKRKVQMWKNCQVSIEHWKYVFNHHGY